MIAGKVVEHGNYLKILAHELDHVAVNRSGRDPTYARIAELSREYKRLQAMPPSVDRSTQMKRIYSEFVPLKAAYDEAQPSQEVHADRVSAFALGRLGKPLPGADQYIRADADTYPSDQMAAANIDGYLEGARARFLDELALRLPPRAERARATAQFRAYLSGYRKALEAQARRSLELPAAKGLVRPRGDTPAARGWNDAIKDVPPHLAASPATGQRASRRSARPK
jgi:hypothetical protein